MCFYIKSPENYFRNYPLPSLALYKGVSSTVQSLLHTPCPFGYTPKECCPVDYLQSALRLFPYNRGRINTKMPSCQIPSLPPLPHPIPIKGDYASKCYPANYPHSSLSLTLSPQGAARHQNAILPITLTSPSPSPYHHRGRLCAKMLSCQIPKLFPPPLPIPPCNYSPSPSISIGSETPTWDTYTVHFLLSKQYIV